MARLTKVQKLKQKYSARAPAAICICAHTGDGANGQHENTVALGHGKCTAEGCCCMRFSWFRWTKEYEDFTVKGLEKK